MSFADLPATQRYALQPLPPFVMAPNASSYSPTRGALLHSRRAKKSRTPSLVKTQMAVLNWENVLVPLDWMAHNLSPMTSIASIQHAAMRCRSSPELVGAMEAIETRVLELLAETLRSVDGPLVIVSEYTTSYVELVSELFFPRLTAALRNVTTGMYVVGTPDTHLTALEMKKWKVNVLRTAIIERLCQLNENAAEQLLARYTVGRIGVVALCANETDIAATSAIHSLAPHAVIKRIKIQSCYELPPALEKFYARFETLKKFVKQAAAANQPISISM